MTSEVSVIKNQRNFIQVEEGCELQLVEQHIGFSDSNYFSNNMTQIDLKNNASMRHYLIQNESDHAFHINNIQVRLDEKSHYDSYAIAVGGKMARTDIY